MINITEKAKGYLTEMVWAKDKKYAFLSVNGGGCSGFRYKCDMLDKPVDGHLVEDILYIDKIAEMFVIGCTVDYVTEFGGSYLKVINPNAVASCGCGESFSI